MGLAPEGEFFRNLRETIRRGRQVGPAVSQPLVVREIGGEYVYINPAFYREFGYTLNDLQSRPFEELWGASRADILDKTDAELMRVGAHQVFSHAFIHPASHAPATGTNISALLLEGGRTYRISLVIRVEEMQVRRTMPRRFI